ncbi:ethanolamine ammonia-lyase light chain [Azorhizobium oxalatiphilum]|uniref:Ethanolamine ammonia-lyase small subunit n=1 Tax=Azorhizobium oxalatiphilum TaxID=980631 RepID=A0A917FCE0_9HYPH|nr:ethanolamine ammonia-lyase subunit EutC [Azorhizobium oxalatiphilum]GGF65782.1 ethanolamine ammonia-lyase light chain [Azorhizobium oxalatiphilum]
MSAHPPRDPWSGLARHTPARIALGRTGASLPTEEVLKFALAHAQARDAVHTPFDAAATAEQVRGLGFETLEVASAAPARDTYLRRPDLGRKLGEESRALLGARSAPAVDLALVVADGLSSAAVHAQAVPFLAALKPWIAQEGWTTPPVVIAREARVALGDEAGALLNARAVLVMIGERPGLSSPDSLGLYLTLGPRVGLSDAVRNCISNVRAEGLSHAAAAFKLAWLLKEAFRRGLTGVDLKDESDDFLVEGKPPLRLG